jgi:lysophospholipase L1-like esterase
MDRVIRLHRCLEDTSQIKGILRMKQAGTSFYRRVMHAFAMVLLVIGPSIGASGAHAAYPEDWASSWIAAPQPPMPGSLDHYHAQSLRLIVHVSAGGSQVRIRLSNLYGNVPLTIGAAHIAHRTSGADIDPASDHALTFGGRPSVVIPAHAMVASDPVHLRVPALTDLSVSLYLPKDVTATTVHILAQQTSYVSRPGDATAATHFPVARRIDMWPFLIGVDVMAPPPSFAVVAFGDSMVDGDGSTADTNQRWPDALAARLQQAGKNVAVLNAGLIGNRLLHGSPAGSRFGAALGEAGLARFYRDAVDQAGAKVVIVRIGGNDIGFMQVLAPAGEAIDAKNLIAGYRQLIASAHQHGLGIIGTTIPPFENAALPGYATPAKDAVRQQVNAWIRHGGAFDAVLDFDRILRDPSHPARLLPTYDSGDHLHPNDMGYRAVASALSLATLNQLASGSGSNTSHLDRQGEGD